MRDVSIGLDENWCSVDIELRYHTKVSLTLPKAAAGHLITGAFSSVPTAVPSTILLSGNEWLGLEDQVKKLRIFVSGVKAVASAAKLVVDNDIDIDSRYLLGRLMGVLTEATDRTNVTSGVVSQNDYAMLLDSIGVPRLWSKL